MRLFALEHTTAAYLADFAFYGSAVAALAAFWDYVCGSMLAVAGPVHR